MVTASIVSHGHGPIVIRLVELLLACPEIRKIIITQNILEHVDYPVDSRLKIIRNEVPRGYGANHNAAFAGITTPFFCVLNPDIWFEANPFPLLLDCLQDGQVAACAPVMVTPEGRQADSARKFPTLASLLIKAAGLCDGTYKVADDRQNPDWLAGMFLVLRARAFREVAGFDEKYFLYYEDVDLCWRLRQGGYSIRQVHEASLVHEARRASRRDWRHACWHLASMARFLGRNTRA
jgi:N-acetylglucosaminyl-diphospho-decaprenol L-rhamnosyltransferase